MNRGKDKEWVVKLEVLCSIIPAYLLLILIKTNEKRLKKTQHVYRDSLFSIRGTARHAISNIFALELSRGGEDGSNYKEVTCGSWLKGK